MAFEEDSKRRSGSREEGAKGVVQDVSKLLATTRTALVDSESPAGHYRRMRRRQCGIPDLTLSRLGTRGGLTQLESDWRLKATGWSSPERVRRGSAEMRPMLAVLRRAESRLGEGGGEDSEESEEEEEDSPSSSSSVSE